MSAFRSVEIDFDVYKMIETERRGFDDLPIAALRRLLGLGDTAVSTDASHPAAPISGRSWEDDGVILPDGTEARMSYNNRTHEGRIIDGKWVVENRSFVSPSAAANAVAVTKSGSKTQLNGWSYWSVRLPGKQRWVPLRSLRQSP